MSLKHTKSLFCKGEKMEYDLNQEKVFNNNHGT